MSIVCGILIIKIKKTLVNCTYFMSFVKFLILYFYLFSVISISYHIFKKFKKITVFTLLFVVNYRGINHFYKKNIFINFKIARRNI